MVVLRHPPSRVVVAAMVLEQEIPQFLDWFLAGADHLACPSSLALVAVVGWLMGFVISATRRGPVEGFYAVAKVIASGVTDLAHFSLRRTLAMTMLAVRESIRRRVLIAFAVFVVVMLLAGWYLDVKSDQPARLYLSFVLTTSNYLVMLLALFLSTFSLPNDFKNRTIHTIVTKPVRPLEIVLGRILGFALVGTVILAAMCVVSYVFVVRGLRHEHQSRRRRPPGRGWRYTSRRNDQRGPPPAHVRGGRGRDRPYRPGHGPSAPGHEGGGRNYEIGPPDGMLQARVPKRGTAPVSRPLRQARHGGQRGQRVDVPQLHRRRHAGCGHLDVRRT